jgi:hypothetical protein
MVLANSPQISGVRGYSRTLTHRPHVFTYRAFTVYGWAFTPIRLTNDFITVHGIVSSRPEDLTTPYEKPLTGITFAWFRLNPLSLATTRGITIVFSSCRY